MSYIMKASTQVILHVALLYWCCG